MISPSFSNKLNTISSELGMNPRDLLLVMYLESGINPASINKSIKNPNYQARGLIQFMPDTLKGMGISQKGVDTFTNKPAEDQLDFVKRYIQGNRSLIGGRPFTSATQYYIANFFPKALLRWHGDSPEQNANVVVADRRSPDKRESDAYKANTILDHDKDGVITVRDITSVLMGLEKSSGFQSALNQFNTVAGAGSVSEKQQMSNRPQEQLPVQYTGNQAVAKFVDKMNNFLDHITANSIPNEINKLGHQRSTYLLSVRSNSDYISKLEFARIISLAMKEELGAKSNIHTNGTDVDIECSIDAQKSKGFLATKEICNAISCVFGDATKKLGKLNISVSIYPDLKSKHKELDIRLAELNYRQFQLKFAKGV
jgi:hypothetical protein